MRTLLFFVIAILAPFLLLSQTNEVSTIAGVGIAGYIDGPGGESRLNSPFGIFRDSNGNIYIADAGNNRIRKINPQGFVSTFAGNGAVGSNDSTALESTFNQPTGITTDNKGNFYIADFLNHIIRKIDSNGIVTTIAGSGIEGYKDSISTQAQFSYPRSVAVDSRGNVYVADSWNHRIRKIDTNGNVTTFAGGGENRGVQSEGDYKDGDGDSARFHTPSGLFMDQFDNLYVADPFNHRIRKIDPSGNVTTVAGSGPTGQGNGGNINGSLNEARLNVPTEVAVDSSGKIYIGDTFNSLVRLATKDSVFTLAGSVVGYSDGPAKEARFNYTRGIVSNPSGDSVWVSDYNNHSIRLISKTAPAVGIPTFSMEPNVYPNPSSGLLNVNSSFDNYKLSNTTGKLIRKGNLTHTQLDFRDLESGLYLLFLDNHAPIKVILNN